MKLGGHRGAVAAKAAAKALAAKTDHAAKLRDTVAAIRAQGVVSAAGLVKELNRRGVADDPGGSSSGSAGPLAFAGRSSLSQVASDRQSPSLWTLEVNPIEFDRWLTLSYARRHLDFKIIKPAWNKILIAYHTIAHKFFHSGAVLV